MTLKEKFKQWLNTKPSETLRDIQCEIIADDFAIDFLEWIIRTGFNNTGLEAKQLLKIYKNSKQL